MALLGDKGALQESGTGTEGRKVMPQIPAMLIGKEPDNIYSPQERKSRAHNINGCEVLTSRRLQTDSGMAENRD